MPSASASSGCSPTARVTASADAPAAISRDARRHPRDRSARVDDAHETAAVTRFESGRCDDGFSALLPATDFSASCAFTLAWHFAEFGETESVERKLRAERAQHASSLRRASPGSFDPAAAVCATPSTLTYVPLISGARPIGRSRVRGALHAVAGIRADVDAELGVIARIVERFAVGTTSAVPA